MQSLSTHTVVEQMTSNLAARRRTLAGRRAAYLALARVILQTGSVVCPPAQRSDSCRKGARRGRLEELCVDPLVSLGHRSRREAALGFRPAVVAVQLR